MSQESANTAKPSVPDACNGAESLVATLVESGVEVCFANPGTSEMHFVSALDRISGMRPVLCLFEGVVTGAADGYARMTGRPACTLLHLGPGFANGMANMHNARRAQSPMVNIVGDHATYHERYNAPLKSNVKGFAEAISHWVHRSESPRTVAADAARAVQAARQAPGRVATLILPADTAWLPAERPAPRLGVCPPAKVAEGAIDAAAQALSSGKKNGDPPARRRAPWRRASGRRAHCRQNRGHTFLRHLPPPSAVRSRVTGRRIAAVPRPGHSAPSGPL